MWPDVHEDVDCDANISAESTKLKGTHQTGVVVAAEEPREEQRDAGGACDRLVRRRYRGSCQMFYYLFTLFHLLHSRALPRGHARPLRDLRLS